MKAKIENGIIKVYINLPSRYRSETLNIAGGFNILDFETHESEGFFDVEIPVFDNDIEQLGAIYFDEINKVFTYPVIEQELDLETLKAEKLAEFDKILETEMTPALMFGVLEKLAMGEPIPQQTIASITALRVRETEVKNLINSVTDAKQMKKFGFDPVEVEQSKDLLKSGRKL